MQCVLAGAPTEPALGPSCRQRRSRRLPSAPSAAAHPWCRFQRSHRAPRAGRSKVPAPSRNRSALLPLCRLQQERQETMASEPLGILSVKVVPTGGQFRWAVRDDRGQVIASASESYPTERTALHAGNAAARAIRKRLEGRQDMHQRGFAHDKTWIASLNFRQDRSENKSYARPPDPTVGSMFTPASVDFRARGACRNPRAPHRATERGQGTAQGCAEGYLEFPAAKERMGARAPPRRRSAVAQKSRWKKK